jgi:hypothetical protein
MGHGEKSRVVRRIRDLAVRSASSLGCVALLTAASTFLAGCNSEEPEQTGHPAVGRLEQKLSADSHLLLLVSSSGGSFTLVGSREVPGPLPTRRGPPQARDWSLRAQSSSGAVLHSAPLPDPHTLRGEFPASAAGNIEAFQQTQAATVFPIRVPLGSRSVEFFDERTPAAGARTRAVSNRIGVLQLPG